jgi:hypothetical protein
VASFSGLSINLPGNNYTLTATGTGLTPAISVPAVSADFNIVTVYVPCPGSCNGTVTNNSSTTGSVSTSSGSPGDFLEMDLGAVNYNCLASGYTATSAPVTFDLYNSTGVQNAAFTGTLDISKAAVQASGHEGASTWQVCYLSTADFTAQLTPTTTGLAPPFGTTGYFVGLLPECSSTHAAPCWETRNKTGAGVEVITFLATGDPGLRS